MTNKVKAGGKIPYNKSGVKEITRNKPIVYTIKTATGATNYVGIAKRGRGPDRVAEHMTKGSKDYVPGASVEVKELPSIAESRKVEKTKIARQNPKYNIEGRTDN